MDAETELLQGRGTALTLLRLECLLRDHHPVLAEVHALVADVVDRVVDIGRTEGTVEGMEADAFFSDHSRSRR